MMTEALTLLGGGTLGMSLFSRQRRKKKNNRLLVDQTKRLQIGRAHV